ncbi:MAG: hypothetical protein ABH812_01160 [bacterium]
MASLISNIKPHYSDEGATSKVKKVDNLNSGTISEMVGIIKKNKKILEELARTDENPHK